MPRPDLDSTFLETARTFAARSTCPRGRVGCVAVRDRLPVMAGYNGAPPGFPHCEDEGCLGVCERCGGTGKDPSVSTPAPSWVGLGAGPDTRCISCKGKPAPDGCQRATHAEANLVAHAARGGIPLGGATIYSTHAPCLPCARLLLSAGIRRLVYEAAYRDGRGLALLDDAGIEFSVSDELGEQHPEEGGVAPSSSAGQNWTWGLKERPLDRPVPPSGRVGW